MLAGIGQSEDLLNREIIRVDLYHALQHTLRMCKVLFAHVGLRQQIQDLQVMGIARDHRLEEADRHVRPIAGECDTSCCDVGDVASFLLYQRSKADQQKDSRYKGQSVVTCASNWLLQEVRPDDGAERQSHDQPANVPGVVDGRYRCSQSEVDYGYPDQIFQETIAHTFWKRELAQIKGGNERSHNAEQSAGGARTDSHGIMQQAQEAARDA